jgi:hypothetical protein
MAIAPIIPPRTRTTGIGNHPVEVCAPSGASAVTVANSAPSLGGLITCYLICPLGGGFLE